MPSVSQKQHNLMAMVANDPAKAKQLGIPKSVGKEFVQADKGLKFKGTGSRADLQKINAPKTEHGKSGIMARGGEVKESKAMVKKEVAFMKQKGAPKSMVKHEMAEMGMRRGGVAKTVTKEMEYDYKTGKKSFAGTTAQRDAHAEKEGRRVAKALAYDKSKGYAKGGLAAGHKSADGIASKGKTRAMKPTMSKSKPLGMKYGGSC